MIKFLYDMVGKVIAKNHELYVDEFDVTRTLRVVNSIVSTMHCEMRVGCCGWADSPRTWYININATDKEWKKLVACLNIMRIWSVTEIPRCIMNGVYSTD